MMRVLYRADFGGNLPASCLSGNLDKALIVRTGEHPLACVLVCCQREIVSGEQCKKPGTGNGAGFALRCSFLGTGNVSNHPANHLTR